MKIGICVMEKTYYRCHIENLYSYLFLSTSFDSTFTQWRVCVCCFWATAGYTFTVKYMQMWWLAITAKVIPPEQLGKGAVWAHQWLLEGYLLLEFSPNCFFPSQSGFDRQSQWLSASSNHQAAAICKAGATYHKATMQIINPSVTSGKYLSE